MTKLQFQTKVNNELAKKPFGIRVVKTEVAGVIVILIFDKLNLAALKWLNNRFAYGISVVENTTRVCINSPFEKKTII